MQHARVYVCMHHLSSVPTTISSTTTATPSATTAAVATALSVPRRLVLGNGSAAGRLLFYYFFFYFLSSPFLNLGLSFPSPTYHESQMINKRVKRKKLQTFGYLSFPITRRIQSRRFPTRENRTKTRSFLFILIVNNNYRQQRNTTKNVNPQGCSCPLDAPVAILMARTAISV